ncbi:TPA: hypothetical protein VIN20_000562 [Streptococcus pyogenes]|nr:hypothetical protein [Streptococcus pyogenes]
MTKQQIEKLADLLPPFAATLYLDMIPEFQEGYASYVYQTPKQDIQKRRIKQLTKNFERLLDTPSFYVMPVTRKTAEQLLADKGLAYHLLSTVAANQVFAAAVNEDQTLFQVLRNGARVAFVILQEKGEFLEMTLGILETVTENEVPAAIVEAVQTYLLVDMQEKLPSLRIMVSQESSKLFYQEQGFVLLAKGCKPGNENDSDVCQLVKYFSKP